MICSNIKGCCYELGMGLITLYDLAGNLSMRCPNKDGNFFKLKTLDFEN